MTKFFENGNFSNGRGRNAVVFAFESNFLERVNLRRRTVTNFVNDSVSSWTRNFRCKIVLGGEIVRIRSPSPTLLKRSKSSMLNWDGIFQKDNRSESRMKPTLNVERRNEKKTSRRRTTNRLYRFSLDLELVTVRRSSPMDICSTKTTAERTSNENFFSIRTKTFFESNFFIDVFSSNKIRLENSPNDVATWSSHRLEKTILFFVSTFDFIQQFTENKRGRIRIDRNLTKLFYISTQKNNSQHFLSFTTRKSFLSTFVLSAKVFRGFSSFVCATVRPERQRSFVCRSSPENCHRPSSFLRWKSRNRFDSKFAEFCFCPSSIRLAFRRSSTSRGIDEIFWTNKKRKPTVFLSFLDERNRLSTNLFVWLPRENRFDRNFDFLLLVELTRARDVRDNEQRRQRTSVSMKNKEKFSSIRNSFRRTVKAETRSLFSVRSTDCRNDRFCWSRLAEGSFV